MKLVRLPASRSDIKENHRDKVALPDRKVARVVPILQDLCKTKKEPNLTIIERKKNDKKIIR